MPTVLRKATTFRLSEGVRLALAKLLRKLGLIGRDAPSDAAMIKIVDVFCSPPNVSGTPLTGPRDVSVADDLGRISSVTSGPREDLDSTIPF